MRLPLNRYVFVGVLVSPLLANGGESPPRVDVHLAADKTTVVLGEPVLLTVTVRNADEKPIEAQEVFLQEDGAEPEIAVYIAQEREFFQEYRMGIYPILSAERKLEVLQPGEGKDYRLRVLYTSERENRLAFDQRGKWSVKTSYRLVWRDSLGYFRGDDFESNTIDIKVTFPRDTDARLWEHVRRPDFLYFLQSGGVLDRTHGGDPKLPLQAAELLQQLPGCSYDAPIRWALKEYYESERSSLTYDEAQRNPVLSRLRSVLGMVEEAPSEGPFPEDTRLDAIVTYYFPDLTPLDVITEQVCSQTGVRLRIAPELRVRRITSSLMTESLRRFMNKCGGPDATWVREGKGYRLAPMPEKK